MAHRGLLDLFSQAESIERAREAILSGRTPLLFLGARGYAKTVSWAALFHKIGRPLVLVVPSPEEAVIARRDLSDLVGIDETLLFPAREAIPFAAHDNWELMCMRISCLSRLARGDNLAFLVLPITAIARKLMTRREFLENSITLDPGERISLRSVVETLVRSGYEREFTVEHPGQFAQRGGILDVFPPTSPYPVRVEFLGDEIDSLRTFDVESQTSLENIDKVLLTPATDTPLETTGYISEKEEENPFETLFDYLPSEALVVLDDYGRSLETLREFEKMGVEIASARMAAGTMTAREASAYLSASHVLSLFVPRACAVFSQVPRAYEDVRFSEVVESDASAQVGFSGHWDEMAEELKDLIRQKKAVVILAGNKERQDVLERWLTREELPVESTDSLASAPSRGVITLALGSGENGFNCDVLGLSVFTEAEIYGRPKVRRRGQRRKARIPIDWRELSAGDYVVHLNHGIGQFMGIKTMTVNGAVRDYLHIRYAGQDALYVPIDQVDMIEKYLGPDGKPPALQRLGTGEWQRVKARVKRSVEEMARKLILLEAKRKSRKGHAFSPDMPWQRQFEEAFEYEDTEDQLTATEEIKRDMEKPTPMDRLLCGDVGYGKTEVAMRCAFKAVMDSKQVAVLVPTTILAEQHYYTFSRRFAGYPVSIEALSRFRTGHEEKKILRDLETGALDIVIGTHRLLSKDVKFKDLGLLIIDEEHRFGVAQKEKLKELSETCDVLTLTATPIPRTLNMVLSGIRDMSVIETPPEGRFPVETYVVPYNPSLISWAIRREMRRGGQVFYVYNRVYSIARVFQKVQALVPEARIAVAHGQMKEGDLARVMQDFLQGRYDVLLSTTIIESGLDLPNTNTLIVEDADRFGLAQLYQLRGRVGRSTRIAYSYFTYRPDRNLTVEAEERLNALRDFAAMGSGFKLAMRDMEIRGAGNLLGPEQHGFMALVGYDMYIRLLEKAVRSLRGQKEEKRERISTSVGIDCDAYLPESYLENPKDRFLFYKRIAGADDWDTLEEIREELEDRYGPLPKAVDNLLKVAKLRVASGAVGITSASLVDEDAVLGRKSLRFSIEVPHLFPAEKLASMPRELARRVELDERTGTLTLRLPAVTPEEALEEGLGLAGHLISW